jgi:YVTN family beta-propeller protein
MHSFWPAVVLTMCLASAAAAQDGGRLIVLNKTDATLVAVDPSTGRITGTVPVGEGPHEAAVSDDGRWAFAANYGAATPGSTISVVDLQSMKEVRRVEVSPLRRPHGLFFRNGKLYFTAETNRVVGRYDPAADKIDWLMGTGQAVTHMVWVGPDDARIVTANIGSNSITVLERGANPLAWTETAVAVGRGPEGFDVSPDGREVWVAHSQDGGVSIVDLASKKVSATFDVQTKRSNRLTFTPDGRTVLITDLGSGDLVVVDARSRAVTKRVPLGKSPAGILIAPDGATAYVAVTGDDNIAVVDLKTLRVSRRLQSGGGPDGMAYAGGK